VLQRLANESRTHFGKLTDSALYVQIEKQGGFVFPPLRAPLLTIDTSAVEAGHAAQQIAKALADAA